MKLGASFALLLVAFTASAAESRTYVLAIGNNTPPVGSALEPLRYADDDAGDFYSFAQSFADGGALLTVLDTESQRRFPDLLGLAQPPTLVGSKRQVARLGELIAADVAAGREPTVLLFFSGHGTSGLDGGAPALALLDGPLTQAVLYEEILATLPARYVHLLVDACHAEAVVRPRDLDAAPVAVTASDMRTWAARETLARFPYVGAVLATTASAEAHEWDSYQRGVFTHEILSGMRGGADVNGDGRVEYSELSAFLGAANGEVLDARARVAVVLHPPALNGRAPLVDLTGAHGLARLVGQMASLGALFVEDERGNRLADVHAEPGFDVSVAVPAGQLLFVCAAPTAKRACAPHRARPSRWPASHFRRLRRDRAAPSSPRCARGYSRRSSVPATTAGTSTRTPSWSACRWPRRATTWSSRCRRPSWRRRPLRRHRARRA